jgi:hypothetical protein
MPDNVDELIKEIAVKHGIAVSRDDPILILQTINNRLMQDSEKAQDALGGIMQESAKATAAAMRSEIESALNIVANNLRAARTIGMLNVVASCITMLASAVALWVILR